VLLTAAGLKLLEAVTNPLAGGPFFGTRWELLVVLEVEVLLALALLLGLYPALTRWLAIGCFLIFAGVNLYQWQAGASTCGCFGPVRVHPAYSLALDLAVLGALCWWRPAPGPIWSAEKTFLLGLGALFWVPVAMLASSATDPDDLDKPGGVVVLHPEEWVGQPFPLLDRLRGGGRLRHGQWVVVFHRRGCPACTALLEEIKELTGEDRGLIAGVRFACIEVPSGERVASAEASPCDKNLHLFAEREWIMKTPMCVRMSNGFTEAATSDLEAVRRWFAH
jgi:hypothetical protein